MSNYSILNHTLSLNTTFSVLSVQDATATTVATFALGVPHLVKCESGDYVIQSTEMPGGHYQNFDAAENDTFNFVNTDGIGISDLRTLKNGTPAQATFSYHLNACPITMQYLDGELVVQSPCTSSDCEIPSANCCTIS